MAEAAAAAAKKLSLKRKRSSAKGQFHTIYNRFNRGYNDGEDKSLLQCMVGDLESAYRKVEEKHLDYFEELDESDDQDKIAMNNANDCLQTLYDELCKARALVVSIDVPKTPVHPVEKVEAPPAIADPNNADASPKSSSLSLIKVKRLDPPSFSGGVKEYPSFKYDFKTHMIPTYGKDPYALKKCLTGDALKLIQGIDNDYNEMMSRLDDRYGRPEKLVDEILCELRRLKPVEDDDCKKFIELVQTVETCWLNMNRVNLPNEMSSIAIISQIEMLLPPTPLREWARLKLQTKSGIIENQFEKLLEFLIQERRAVEYIQEDVRRRADQSCRRKVNITEMNEVTEGSSRDVNHLDELLTKQRKHNEDFMNKVVEGFSQIVIALGKTKEAGNKSDSRYLVTKCWYHNSDKHTIAECYSFKSMDYEGKMRIIREKGACFRCLCLGHMSRACQFKVPCDVIVENSQQCGKMHHNLLHRDDILIKAASNNTQEDPSESLLMISMVICRGQQLITLYDSGANVSLITRECARQLGLKGKPVTLRITKSGNVTDSGPSKEYTLPLTDMENKVWNITVYEMNEITAEVSPTDVGKLHKLFEGVTAEDIRRPAGKVDLLIDTDCCVLLPNKIGQVGNLQLMKNQFGFCLRGSHPSLRGSWETYHCKLAYLSKVSIHEGDMSDFTKMRNIEEIMEDFLTIERLGTQSIPKAEGCKCISSSIGSNNFTPKEVKELNLIESGLSLNQEKKQWSVIYPWIKDPYQLPNNYKAALGRLSSLERRIKKVGVEYIKMYDEQMKDMETRGIARKLTKYELNEYKGPVYYFPHREVWKPDSKSTKLRIVGDPSTSYMGHTLNDYWAKGPCINNNLLTVLLRFRRKNYAFVADISKMYNMVHLSIKDQHTHRFLWRDGDTSRAPDHYVLEAMLFGDRPSGNIATLALRKTADLFKDVFPEEVAVIKDDCYVDDLLGSADTLLDAKTKTQNIDTILDAGGFKVKGWTLSGDCLNPDSTYMPIKEEEKVLGMLWDPELDVFRFRVKINFSPLRRNQRLGMDLKKGDIESAIPEYISRRMVLSQIASLFDPLGLVIPVTLEAKDLMRRICLAGRSDDTENSITWDDPINEKLRIECVRLFGNLFEIEALRFRRCVKPWNGLHNPILIIFCDASELAYGCCAYVRWQTGDNSYEAHLLVAKNRIAPRRKLTIPRLELCGAVIAARLRDKITREMDYAFERVFHITDSSIVRAQIQKESHGFSTFVATRIGEIQRKTEPSEWWWVSSDQNPADMTTRVTSPTNIGPGSVWQIGPSFLKDPIEKWPLSKECNIAPPELPDRVKISMTTSVQYNVNEEVSLSDIRIDQFNDFQKLMIVTAMVAKIARNKSFKSGGDIGSDDLANAEGLWINFVQSDLKKSNWKYIFRRLGPTTNSLGQLVVGGRMAEWLKYDWNAESYILLPQKDRYSWLYTKSIHEIDHAGVDVSLAKIRRKYWIPRCRPLIRSIKNRCVICRYLELEVIGQKMGNLPMKRLHPCPPFYHCAVDLFGPFTIRDNVKKRSRGKAYGVVFTDLTSRGIHIDVADSYDTNSFLNVLRRFTSIRGYPKTMYSDRGSQLVCANKELKEIQDKWDQNKINQFGKQYGMEWTTTKAADAPWENGCCEAMVKLVKRNVKLAVGSHVLTFPELQTVLYEIANLLNERPIGTKTRDANEGSYLCPNDLMLGRASNHVPSGYMEMADDPRKRYQFIQMIINTFWKKWQMYYFHTLLIRQKWHTKKRNLVKGDLVLVQESNAIRGEWKLAQIDEAEAGKDGLVRDVSIRYKTQGPGNQYKGQKDVVVDRSAHRLVLLLPIEEQ